MATIVMAPALPAWAQDATASGPAKPTLELYGFAMLDLGHDFKQIDPSWFDTMRVSKLPSVENQFGRDHSTYAGVRQSRLGVRSSMPTSLGELKTTFEFDLFGTGVDEGQTTFKLRHAYGEVGAFGAGQTWSPFMDTGVLPTVIEHWGPTGMVFSRNAQVRWMPIKGASELTFAIERPGASGDDGVYAGRIELEDIDGRFPVPDFSAAYKVSRQWGYARAAGIVRMIRWDDLNDDQLDLSGKATGWGVSFSSNLNAGSHDIVKAQLTFGVGIQNYMRDAPVDVGIVRNPSSATRPFDGAAIPIVGFVLFLDHRWSNRLTSAIGYSRQDNDNTTGQAANAFRIGHYALGNLLYTPATNVMVGGEVQWGRRENHSDGFQSDGLKLQVSFRYNFSFTLVQ
jgi:hypothetical protein